MPLVKARSPIDSDFLDNFGLVIVFVAFGSDEDADRATVVGVDDRIGVDKEGRSAGI